ncbi:uncharacterized protein LOC126847505 isoform X2 [Adelges cooleyi]|uniref:uncharacterized protein LOC126847505 isoform X2 n=1 Tax=Adelges cooleyi TaxID=133065 RepID=UPI00217FBCED|nr:uncharacterized protein LOC126847505 isoform X2 [Adelges cooleyi]
MDFKTAFFLSYITGFVILTMTTGVRCAPVQANTDGSGKRLVGSTYNPKIIHNNAGTFVDGKKKAVDTKGFTYGPKINIGNDGAVIDDPLNAADTESSGEISEDVKKRPLGAANTDGSRQTSVQQTGLNNENVPNQPVNIGVISAIKRFIGWLKNCGARGKENPAHL